MVTFVPSFRPYSLSNLNLNYGVHPTSGSVQWPLPPGLMVPHSPALQPSMLHPLRAFLSTLPSTHFWCHASSAGRPGQGGPELGVR